MKRARSLWKFSQQIFLICALLTSVLSWAVTGEGVLLLKADKLYLRPDAQSRRVALLIQPGEKLFVLGTFDSKRWYKVLHASGATGWLPYWNLKMVALNAEDKNFLDLQVERKMRSTYRYIVQAEGSYGTGPFELGAGGDFFINLARNGLLGKRYEQIEIGAGFRYHLGEEGFYEVPLSLQWMFRFGDHGDMMLGPFVGFSVVKDPRFRFDHALPFRGGLSYRYYFSEYVGVYANAGLWARSVMDAFVAGGLSLRL